MKPFGRVGATLGALLLLRATLDAVDVYADPIRYMNHEEAYNASVAWMTWQGRLWDQLLALQYKAFCGGCTVVSATAAPWLALFGDSFAAWKALAWVWSAAILLLSFVALDRTAGRAAAWTGAVLLALPLPGLGALDHMLWGNHREVALLILGAVALLKGGRPVGAALVCGLAVWFTRTGVYGAVVLVPMALLAAPSPRRRATVAGAFLLGLLPMAMPAARGDVGFYSLSLSDHLLPRGPLGAAGRATQLVAGLGERMLPGWGSEVGSWVVVAASVAAAAACLHARRARVWVLLAGSYATAMCLTGFDLPIARPDSPLVNHRYFAPWFLLLTLLLAAGWGPYLAQRGRARLLAGAALALTLLVSLTGRAVSLARSPRSPHLAGLRATDLTHFTLVAAHRIARPEERHSREANAEQALRVIEGVRRAWMTPDGPRATEGIDSPGVLFGAGEALVRTPWGARQIQDSARWLEGLPRERAVWIGRGVAATLGFDLAGRRSSASGPDEVATTLAELGGDGPCWLCPAAGSVAAVRCGAFDPSIATDAFAHCLDEAAGQTAHRGAVLYGAGATYFRPWRDAGDCARLAERFGPQFESGLHSPAAGLLAPKRPDAFRRTSRRRTP